MSYKKSLRQLLSESEEIVMCPEIFDCSSAKCVELCGFQAILLSSAEFSCSIMGNPDMGLITLDDVAGATERIAAFSPLPLVIDADDGFGKPINTYHACVRIARAGASGILITDLDAEGKIIPQEDAVKRFTAAHAALKDTDCMLIARCDVDPYKNLDEACARCNAYLEAGAEMTLLVELNKAPAEKKMELCREISRRVPGWKMYPDLGSKDGKSDVAIDDLTPLGFKFVGIHYLMYAALEGMLDYGHHIFKDRNNTYFNKTLAPDPHFVCPCELFGLQDHYWQDIEMNWEKRPEDTISGKRSDFFCHMETHMK